MTDSRNPDRTGQFVRQSLAGGLLILLPLAIIAFFFKWVYQLVTGTISPVTMVFVDGLGMPRAVADVLVVVLLVLLCFMVGNLVATRMGQWLWKRMESWLVARVPGYRMVQEITMQVLGKSDDSPFRRGEVARFWLYGREAGVSVTALVTSHHPDGQMTVFVPTGPNPTSGFIYHAPADLVELRPDIRVDQMMKTVLSCGAGSGSLWATGKPAATATGEQDRP
ncbi:MAG: DUF502 domain-containing protein [Alcanivoracaceae bacterium]